MRIIVTSGGTTEYIDDVRVLTNISTGRLGAMIATELAEAGHDVVYVSSKTAILPTGGDFNYEEVTDVASLMKSMRELVPVADVVIHAMAVSDFGFRRDKAVKLKSSDPKAFIAHMLENIETNPKVISYIKTWNPKVTLVGFKFEVGKTHDELIDIACESMLRNNCDLMIANDKEEMKREKEHIAYAIGYQTYKNRILRKHDPKITGCDAEKLIGKMAISDYLVRFIEGLPNYKVVDGLPEN